MPPVGFEPTISAGERPQTYALDRTATGTGIDGTLFIRIFIFFPKNIFTYDFVLFFAYNIRG